MALEKTLPILLMFLIGLGLKRMKILRPEHGQVISQIILYVALPATIINSLTTITLSPALLLYPAAGLVLVVLLFACGFALAPLLGLTRKTRGAFLVAFSGLELGSIGYAFMALYGTAGIATMAFIDLGNAFFFFTVGALVASLYGSSGEQFQLSDALLRFVKNPVLWSYGVGMMGNVFHVHILVLSNLFTSLSQALFLLVMLLIAAEFSFDWRVKSLLLPSLTVYVKMAIGITLGVGLSLLFHLSGMGRMALVLAASLPASLMSVVYAREHALDSRFLTSMFSLALPISIGSSSLLMALR